MTEKQSYSAKYDEFEELVDKKNELLGNIENGDLPAVQKKIEVDNINMYFWGRVNEIVLLHQEQIIEICREPQQDFGEEIAPCPDMLKEVSELFDIIDPPLNDLEKYPDGKDYGEVGVDTK